MEKKGELNVEGMTCANCALSVTKSLEKKGAEDVNVDFITGEATFKYDGSKFHDLDVFAEAVNDTGYSAMPSSSKPGGDGKEQKSPLARRLIISAIFTAPLFLSMFFNIPEWLQLILAIPVLVVGTQQFLKSSIGSIKSGVANMDVLVLLGAYASFLYSAVNNFLLGNPESYYETAGVIITLVILGKFFEKRSLNKAKDAVEAFSKLLPDKALKIVNQQTSETEEIEVDRIKVGDFILVRDGEKVPADGKVTQGEGHFNESLLTGESTSVHKQKNDLLIAGSINEGGTVTMMANKVGENTYLSNIVELVKKARSEKPEIQKLADRISAVFVPTVIGLSIITFFTWFFLDAGPSTAVMNAIAVLVISCPCAMGLATPTAVIVALGRGAKKGVFYKSGAIIEMLQRINVVLFDKTGTLTTGEFTISEIKPREPFSRQEIVDVVYGLEQASLHPVARSLVGALKSEKKLKPFLDTREIKGQGVTGKDPDGNQYKVGAFGDESKEGIGIYKNDAFMGEIILKDEVRPNAGALMDFLNRKNIRTVLVSGDKKKKCEAIAQELQVQRVYSEQKPEEKIELVKNYNQSGMTAFVGDGINDGPALSQAAIGISMIKATEVAISSSDLVVEEKNFMQNIITGFKLSTTAYRVIRQNLFWAFFYNTLAIPLAMLGLLNPMIAAGAMSLSSLFVVGNSLRIKTPS